MTTVNDDSGIVSQFVFDTQTYKPGTVFVYYSITYMVVAATEIHLHVCYVSDKQVKEKTLSLKDVLNNMNAQPKIVHKPTR
jgi:hypothetical protein